MSTYLVLLASGMTLISRGHVVTGDAGDNVLQLTEPYMLQFMEHPRQPGMMVPQVMPYSLIPGITTPRKELNLRPGQYVDYEEAEEKMSAIYTKATTGLEIAARSPIQLAKR
jgi:hypothetical protein